MSWKVVDKDLIILEWDDEGGKDPKPVDKPQEALDPPKEWVNVSYTVYEDALVARDDQDEASGLPDGYHLFGIIEGDDGRFHTILHKDLVAGRAEKRSLPNGSSDSKRITKNTHKDLVAGRAEKPLCVVGEPTSYHDALKHNHLQRKIESVGKKGKPRG